VSTSQREVAVILGWEGNYESSIAMAMHYMLWYICLRAQWCKKG